MKYANTWLTPYEIARIYLYLIGNTNPSRSDIFETMGKNGSLTLLLINVAVSIAYRQCFGYDINDVNFTTTLTGNLKAFVSDALTNNCDTLLNIDTPTTSMDDTVSKYLSGELTDSEISGIINNIGETIGVDIVNNHLTFFKAFIENVNYYGYITSQNGAHEVNSEYEGSPMEKVISTSSNPINENKNPSATETILASGISNQLINEMRYNGPAWYKAMGSYSSEMDMTWIKKSINKMFVEVF